MPRVFDTFPVYNEFDLVTLRQETLHAVTDCAIAIVSTLTHAGKINTHLGLWRNYQTDNLRVFIHYEHDDNAGLPATRRREMMQRNAILQGLQELGLYGPAADDIILISDADEIPNPAVVSEIARLGLPEGMVVIFRQRLNYYDLNTTQGYVWQGTRAVRYDDLCALSPHVVRYGLGVVDQHYPIYGLVPQGGWHLSYFGGVARVKDKLANFLHQELVSPDNLNDEAIHERIAAGADIYGREEYAWIIEPTIDVPPPVLLQPGRWRSLWRNGMEPD